MITTTLPTKFSRIRKMSPPKLPGASKANSQVKPDKVDLSLARAKSDTPKSNSVGKVFLTATAGAAALTAVAGPAMAQSPPGTEQLVAETVQDIDLFDYQESKKPLDLSLDSIQIQDSLGLDTMSLEKDTLSVRFPISNDTTKVGVQINSINDFMPDSWTDWLGGPQHKTPDGSAFDDDGFTAEVQILTNFQKENSEVVVGGRLVMVTQPGSREPFAEDYEGLRTDIGEFVVQKNLRTKLNDRITLDYGLGGGVQAIGDVGGESFQRWFHEVGPAGGRVGSDLQGNQVTDSFRLMPLVTGGAKVSYEVSPDLDITLRTQASVPLGEGIGNVGFRAGVGKSVGDFNFEVGGKLDATWVDAPELDFHAKSGVREGWYGRVEYEPADWGGFYTQLETGGIRNEPVLTFGVRIGFGGQPRLSPFW